MLLDLNKNWGFKTFITVFIAWSAGGQFNWFECARLCGLPATVRFDCFEWALCVIHWRSVVTGLTTWLVCVTLSIRCDGFEWACCWLTVYCLQVVERLLQSGLCDALLQDSPDDMSDSQRATCLHLAARNGHTDVIQYVQHSRTNLGSRTHAPSNLLSFWILLHV